LEEFEKLWLTHMRNRMVDGFQFLDDDGNAQITLEEIAQPMDRMFNRMDRNDDGQITGDEMKRGKRHAYHDDDDDDDHDDDHHG